MQESRLFSFIDEKSAFTLHFLHGGKLIQDIVQVHNIGPMAYDFYRDTILTSMQMLNFMKATENMGFYIDSNEPYFRLKIEMNERGTMRTLLLPEEFEDFPKTVTGTARVTKAFPNKTPYSSVIQLNEHPAADIVNQALKDSYQMQAKVSVGRADMSVMFSKLPPSKLSEKFEEVIDEPLESFMKTHKNLVTEIEKQDFILKEADESATIDFFTKKGLTYLGSKEVKFYCPCSKERMAANMATLGKKDLDEVFKEKESIEVRCDYCNTVYDINQSELKAQ